MNHPPSNHRGQPQRRPSPPYDPRREAAKRAYYEKKRRQRRRARILLACAALLVFALLIFLIGLIVRGIMAAVNDSEKSLPVDGTTPYNSQITSIDTTSDHSVTPSDTSTAEAKKEEPTYELNFQADLSDYEKYMEPEDRDAYLILVNASHPLDGGYVPDDLIDVVNTRTDGRAIQKMCRTAEKALEALYMEAAAEGIIRADTPSGYPLSVTSAYRDYGTQNYLFGQYTQNEMANNKNLTQAQAEAIVETYSCRPGTSEHQTGLCCDMHTLNGADISFENDAAAVWLAENAWKFGFILRFPKDKTDITGISFEPWHFRFVGRYHAYQIHKDGLCLEEYLEKLQNS